MNTKQGLDIIHKEFIFYSQWWPVQNNANAPSKTDEMVDVDLRRIVRYHKEMAAAGAKIHSFDITTGWKNIDDFDTVDIDRVLKAFFEACPDCYLIPRISDFNPSATWRRAHPDEVHLAEAGEHLTLEEITNYIGSNREYMSGPTETALIGLQSFSSARWRKDALAALRRLIAHFEASPYADRILGYHVGYGKCGETHFWEIGPDFNIINRQAFYDFGVKKYGSAQAAAQAWGMESVSPDNVPLPRKADVPEQICTVSEFIRRDAVTLLDYNEFLRDLAYSLAHDFTSTIKEMTGKVVGIFHGYNMYCGAEHHGHTDLQWIIDDPNIDFICAPKSYYRNAYGEPGGSYCVARSVNRKMLWIDELDNRTHHSIPNDYNWGGSAASAEEFGWIMWREFARNEMAGASYWWMDLGSGWYDDPLLHAELSRLYEVKKKISQRPGNSIADILVIMDETNAMHTVQNLPSYHRFANEPLMELPKTGAVFDFYRQADLKDLDLSQYKLVYFLNTFDMTAEEFHALNFAPGTKFLWNFLPCGDLAEAETVTGMQYAETGTGHWFPYLSVLPGEGVVSLETYADKANDLAKIPGLNFAQAHQEDNNLMRLYHLPENGIRTAQKGDHTVCLLPSPNYHFLRKMAEEAGCKFYAEEGAIVYGDDRFLGIFRKDGYTFTLTDPTL